MSKGVVVFDLDLTLGDFRVIDYFGLIYEPTLIAGRDSKNKDSRDRDIQIWNNYYADKFNITNFLLELRDTFENEFHNEKEFINKILRPDLKKILMPLIEEYKKNKIEKFIIYSNNSSMYPLQYAGREINRMFDTKIDFEYIDRTNKLRDEYDGDITGARTKTIKTIEKVIKHKIKDSDLIFFDDMIPKHEDFDKFLSNTTNYINIPPYYSEIKDDELKNIWHIFEKEFTNLLEKYNIQFSDLTHIRSKLQAKNLDELTKKYLDYSRLRESFIEYNSEDNINNIITEQIKPYITNISKHSGGRKKKRTRKIKNRKV
jgi:hypothetical protein